jgi:hypothetical protein
MDKGAEQYRGSIANNEQVKNEFSEGLGLSNLHHFPVRGLLFAHTLTHHCHIYGPIVTRRQISGTILELQAS